MVIRYESDVFNGIEAKLCFADWSDLDEMYSGMWPSSITRMARDNITEWSGGTHEQMLRYIDSGAREQVANMQEMMDRLVSAIPFETIGRDLSYCVAGYRPVVPAFLAGRPDAMLGLDDGETPEGVVRLFVDPIGVCTLTAEQLVTRGSAVAALVESIQLFRPVELYVYSCGGSWTTAYHSAVVLRVGITPLDIAELYAAVVSPLIGRRMLIVKQQELIGDTNHSEAFPRSAIPEAKLVRATEDDIVVPSLWNRNDEVTTDPVKWVKARLDEAVKQDGEGLAYEGV